MSKSYGIIYKATNLINGKCYIGKSNFDLSKRINGHYNKSKKGNTYFNRALRKYDKSNFKWEIIKECNDDLLLNILETFMIMVYKAYWKENGYNMTWGGDGIKKGYKHNLTDEQRKRQSLINKGKKLSQETKDKISEAKKEHWKREEYRLNQSNRVKGINNPMYGKTGYWKDHEIPQDVKDKISKTLTGTHLSQETKDKISKAGKGRVVTEETREKLRIANIGANNPMYGKTPWNKGMKKHKNEVNE